VGTALAIHREMLPVYTGMMRMPGTVSSKAALAMLGLPGGPVRSPLADATTAEAERLRTDLVAGGVKIR
jgi:4-hydroxy-tetrahydrodipicolinate synthase